MLELSKEEFLLKKKLWAKNVKDGKLFIYPTDTIYGIGCLATDKTAVQKIRDIKQSKSPFSVIAPSKEWIESHCVLDNRGKEWLGKLPGPYTLILKLKNKSDLPIADITNTGLSTLGVRMPGHWITDFVQELGEPIITTSANIKGNNYMTSIEDLDDTIRGKVDFIVHEGKKDGHPSTLIDLSQEPEKITKRG